MFSGHIGASHVSVRFWSGEDVKNGERSESVAHLQGADILLFHGCWQNMDLEVAHEAAVLTAVLAAGVPAFLCHLLELQCPQGAGTEAG